MLGQLLGAILGSLPIAFFLVLAVTSHRELGPVYRSGAGIAMVLAGLALEGVAYAWIRRLGRTETERRVLGASRPRPVGDLPGEAS